ncbi:MAG: HD domain-containing protein [Clostridia bacterium]|nr:HD domain-containing protein [Clostridia bacterium]
MRSIDVSQLNSGMKIAKAIYDDNGRILLNVGTVLTSRYIEKLDSLGIPFVYIEDEIVGHLEVEDLIHDRIKIQTIKALKQITENIRLRAEVDLRQISDMVNSILDDLRGVPNLVVQLLDIRAGNMYVYNHSVSVCVLSLITGMSLSLDELKIKTLGMGAILHDIGKSLSEGPEHTLHGFEILRSNKTLNVTAAHVTYQHHERYDGEGYPRQLKGEEIHLYGAIVAAANYYDNLVSNPDPAKRLHPYQALEVVLAESGRALHPDVVKAFCKNIAPYPIGSTVRLNDGSIGVVISIDQNMPSRPVVKVVANGHGVLLQEFPDLDLMEAPTLFIVDIINEKERRDIIF